MHVGRSSSRSADIIADLAACEAGIADDATWQEVFRAAFDRLYLEIDLHPAAASPGASFAAAAETVRTVSAQCLPLGVGLVMHLYPLCALRGVPLPWWNPANLRRHRLLREIHGGGLILANAGSERVEGSAAAPTLRRARDGVLVTGTFEYVSLAHVADLLLFSAACEGRMLFCVADLAADSARIGASRFRGSMRLSDTCSLRFEDHLLPADRFLSIGTPGALQCLAQYQRSWFHLLLAEAHLARIEWLQARWNLPRPPALLASLNELAFLERFALSLLEDSAAPGAIDSLANVTAAMKLRVSLLAQSTATAIRTSDPAASAELGYIRRQPTCDTSILRSLGDSGRIAPCFASRPSTPRPGSG